jgi:hypothetical protein
LTIELRKETPNEQGQSLPSEDQVESSFTNDKGQSCIQDNLAVESHNLQSSEGQLRKPSSSVRVVVIATHCFMPELGNARSDDLLASQVLGNQLERDLSDQEEVVSSLNSQPEISVSASKKFTNCSLVRCETPSSRFDERRREMDEIEHFLKQDFKFSGFVRQLMGYSPGKERDDWLLEFYKGVYRGHNFKADQVLFNERCSQLGRYIDLYDEECADEQGLLDNLDRMRKDRGSCHFVPGRGRVYSSLVPYDLGQ